MSLPRAVDPDDFDAELWEWQVLKIIALGHDLSDMDGSEDGRLLARCTRCGGLLTMEPSSADAGPPVASLSDSLHLPCRGRRRR